jgi:hypothetical protein
MENSLNKKAEARHQDKYTVQKEIRAIRAQEMEKQRRENEEREKEEQNSRFARNTSTSHINPTPTIANASSSEISKPRGFSVSSNREESSADQDNPKELKVQTRFAFYLIWNFQ